MFRLEISAICLEETGEGLHLLVARLAKKPWGSCELLMRMFLRRHELLLRLALRISEVSKLNYMLEI